MGKAGAFDQADGRVDRCMGGCAEEQKLGGAQPQDPPGRRVRAVERPLDHRAQHLVDFAQPPQDRRQQQAHEGAIARHEGGEALVLCQRVVERLALVEAGTGPRARRAGKQRIIHRAAL